MSTPVIHLLEEDAALGDQLEPDRLQSALGALIAPTIELPTGRWHADEFRTRTPGALGLLILHGLLSRPGGDSRFGGELLGAGDLLRPWQSAPDDPDGFDARWRVLEPTRLAVLDQRVARRVGEYPEIMDALLDRALTRTCELSSRLALTQHRRAQARLHLLFWSLGERYGRMTPEGIVITLTLSHRTLGELVSVRRPAVTVALGHLARQGTISRRDGGDWLLDREPPIELDGHAPGRDGDGTSVSPDLVA